MSEPLNNMQWIKDIQAKLDTNKIDEDVEKKHIEGNRQAIMAATGVNFCGAIPSAITVIETIGNNLGLFISNPFYKAVLFIALPVATGILKLVEMLVCAEQA